MRQADGHLVENQCPGLKENRSNDPRTFYQIENPGGRRGHDACRQKWVRLEQDFYGKGGGKERGGKSSCTARRQPPERLSAPQERGGVEVTEGLKNVKHNNLGEEGGSPRKTKTGKGETCINPEGKKKRELRRKKSRKGMSWSASRHKKSGDRGESKLRRKRSTEYRDGGETLP